jgi:Zn-dependent peptidase ImmA (M78 family)
MNLTISNQDLDLVFGSDTIGITPEERANESKNQFVRSQVQLAPYSDGATGRVLSAKEALRIFHWEMLYQSVIEGSAPLVDSPDEPSATIRKHRIELGLDPDMLAKKAGISVQKLERAETAGMKTPFRELELLAQALALDEQVLGLIPNARRDIALGVRLREMATLEEANGLDATTVLQLTEAAWIIRRQAELQNLLENSTESTRTPTPLYDSSFGYPTYEIGYRLAKKTRSLLNIDDTSPIASVRQIIEENFEIPLIQLKMEPRFAGATIANGAVRGIIVNESGMNSNVLIRRMTLCHELAHFLWDPDDRLQQVSVDEYADLEVSDRESRRDPAEMRANAFAVAFLAPPIAVQKIAEKNSDPLMVVNEVMDTFGISFTAARHHVKNITKLDTSSVYNSSSKSNDDWLVSENLTVDYLSILGVPLSRSGKFAWYVAKAYNLKEISLDSAASWLKIPDIKKAGQILEMVVKLGVAKA